MRGNGHHGGAVARGLEHLFRHGTAAGLDDGTLLRRFVEAGDAAAFEALFARHAGLVHGVCRQWLGDPHDAADAFQATALVLVRKAPGLRVTDTLGPWLYRVACRVAARARSARRLRADRERGGVDVAAVAVADGAGPRVPDDLGPLLHEEIDRLPARFRAAVVLCHLEGLTHAQAAARLRCPVGTVRSRLARGRAALRTRLERRGVDGAALTSAVPFTLPGVPAPLFEATLRAALHGGVGAAPAPVAALTEGVLAMMLMTKLKAAAAAVLTAAALAAGAGTAAVQAYQTPGGSDVGISRPPAGKATTVAATPAPLPSVEALLARKLSFNVDNLPLSDALQFLRVRANLPIVVQEPVDRDAGEGLGTGGLGTRSVAVHARDLPVREVLTQMVTPLGLAFRVTDGVVLIHPADRAPVTSGKRGVTGVAAILAALDGTPAVGLSQSLASALPVLEKITGVPFRLDHAAFRAEGVAEDVPFKLSTADARGGCLSVHEALWQALRAERLGFVVSPDGVVIAPERLNRAERAVERALNQTVTLNLDRTPLGEAVTTIQKVANLPLVLDPRALAEANVTTQTPVSLNVANVRLKTVLKLLLRPLGLTYRVEDEVILVTTPTPTAPATVTKTYAVADLIRPRNTGAGSAPARAQFDGLVDLITSTVAPGTWTVQSPEGGTGNRDTSRPGAITPFFLSLSLIVRHTPEVHDQLTTLFRGLRKLPAFEARGESEGPREPGPSGPLDAGRLLDLTRPPVSQGPARPPLEISLLGPARGAVGSLAVYVIRLIQNEPAGGRPTRVRLKLPDEIRTYAVNDLQPFTFADNVLTWKIAPPPAPGAIRNITFQSRVTRAGTHVLTATAEIMGSGQDPVSASMTTTVEEPPRLGLEVAPRSPTATADGEVAFVIKVRNDGPVAVTRVDLTAALSDNLRPLETSGTAQPSRYDVDGHKVVFPRIDQLAPGQTAELTVRARPARADLDTRALATCRVELRQAGIAGTLDDIAVVKLLPKRAEPGAVGAGPAAPLR